MDVDRIMMSSDTHGSLLNRVSFKLNLYKVYVNSLNAL